MLTVCCECHWILRYHPEDGSGISHGYCKKCAADMLTELDDEKEEECK